MSYRDVQTDIGVGAKVVGMLNLVPGLGQVAGMFEDIVGAFGLADEQDAYNRMIWQYYATPVWEGGGWNPGTPASRAQMRARQRRHFAVYFR
jgi:hypothetical protein